MLSVRLGYHLSMKSKILLTMLGFVLISAPFWPVGATGRPLKTQATQADDVAIGKLVNRLKAETGGLWVNGVYPTLGLPAGASAEQVIAQSIKLSGFAKGHLKTWKLLSLRTVELKDLGAGKTFAALLDSDQGRKILLFHYQGAAAGWWSRFYSGDGSDPFAQPVAPKRSKPASVAP